MTTRNTSAHAQAVAPAATLLLLRDAGASLQVLMLRRQAALRFMGGMWVFPGGRVDPADCTATAAGIVAPDIGPAPDLRTPDGAPLPDSLALGLRIAACRETYEEAGLLLARHRDRRALTPQELAALLSERERVAQTPGAFAELLARTGLTLEVAALVYWSHWITPSHEARRFDTRFFALQMPAGQSASVDRQESTELAWLTPNEACRAAERGEMLLAPPTVLTLEDLGEAYARHGSVERMLAAERGRATPPVMPRIRVEDAETHVLMPWDPGYAHALGEGCDPREGYPAHLTRRRSSLVFRRASPDRG